MYTMAKYEKPATIGDAYQLLSGKRSSVLLGGTTFLRMGRKHIHLGIDLSGLGLDLIQVDETGGLRLGAMCTLRMLETAEPLLNYASGIIPQALRHIVGVQFRNVATLGASVFSKYGFSDLLPALLVCGARVQLYAGGLMTLESFLQRPCVQDILTEIFLPPLDENARGIFACVRNSHSDFAILNGALLLSREECRIAFGARPMTAKLSREARDYIYAEQGSQPLPDLAQTAARLAQEELAFGTNMRGSAEYRRHLCGVLTKRMLGEVLSEGHGGRTI